MRAVRALIEGTCICAAFNGSTGRTHKDYVTCAADVITAQVQTAALRSQCKRTVKRYYAKTTCGRNPNLHSEPCIKRSLTTGKITCAIKPTTKKDGLTPTNACADTATATGVACAGYTQCLAAADANGDLMIAAPGDTAMCVATPIPTATPTATPTFTSTATPTDTPTRTPADTPTFTATDTPTFTPTGTPTPTATPTPVLEAHWKFDEGTGSTVADASGNGHTLTLFNNGWTSGESGTALLDGSNPFALSLDGSYGTDDGTIDLANQSFTVAMWVRGFLTHDDHRTWDFFSQGTTNSTDQTLYLGFRHPDAGTWQTHFTCGFGGGEMTSTPPLGREVM